MSEQPKCDTCTHWEKWYEGSTTFPPLGDCTRMPPTAQSTITEIIAIEEGESNQFYHRGLFPCTRGMDRCGEHTISAEVIEDLADETELAENVETLEKVAKILDKP